MSLTESSGVSVRERVQHVHVLIVGAGELLPAADLDDGTLVYR